SYRGRRSHAPIVLSCRSGSSEMSDQRRRTARASQGTRRWAGGCGLALGCVTLLVGCGYNGDPPASRATPGSSIAVAPDAPGVEQAPSASPAHLTGRESRQVSVTPVAFAESAEESSGGVKSVTFDDIKFEMKKDEKFK